MQVNNSSTHIGIGPLALDNEWMLSNQKVIVDKIINRIKSTCMSISEQKTIGSGKFGRDFISHHVISLVGDRGTGKTSTLLTILKTLRTDVHSALVLDVVRPDAMNIDFPLPVAITQAILESPACQASEIIERLKRENSLKILRQSWALNASEETYRVIARDSLNTSDWTDRLYDLQGKPANMIPKFQDWVETVLELTGRDVLIIPIDDADIAIEKAEEVIDVLRTYLATPRIITLLALDIKALERRIRNLRLSQLPHLPNYNNENGSNIPRLFLQMNPEEFELSEAEEEQNYVENLLAKVLPVSSRYYLSGLSEWERLNSEIYIPGFGKCKSISEMISDIDKNLTDTDGIGLLPLLENHPGLLSTNLRSFVNQFLMICNACSDYNLDQMSLSSQEKEHLFTEYKEETTRTLLSYSSLNEEESGEVGGFRLPVIRNSNEFLRSKFHMAIMRAFLVSSDFSPFLDHVRRILGIELERIPTLHELANFMLHRSDWTGQYNGNLSFRVLERDFNNSSLNELVNLCMDWAISYGINIEDIARQLSIYFSESFLPFPIPERLG